MVDFRTEVATGADSIYLLLFLPFFPHVVFPCPFLFFLITPSLFALTFVESLCSCVFLITNVVEWVPLYGTSLVHQRLYLKRHLCFATLYFQNLVVPPYIPCKNFGKVRWHPKSTSMSQMITKLESAYTEHCESSLQESVQLYCCNLNKWRACLDSLHLFCWSSKP